MRLFSVEMESRRTRTPRSLTFLEMRFMPTYVSFHFKSGARSADPLMLSQRDGSVAKEAFKKNVM